jgi:hypothetical protein
LASTSIEEQTLVDEFIAWLEAQAASEGPAVTLVAGGSAEGVGAGPIGTVVGAGAATLGGYGYYGYETIHAVQNANAADQELLQSTSQMNQALLAHPRPQSLAGRYTDMDRRPGKPGNYDDDDCEKFWEDARAYCSEVASIPRKSRKWKEYQQIWGGSYDRCVKGQIPERCGGSLIE